MLAPRVYSTGRPASSNWSLQLTAISYPRVCRLAVFMSGTLAPYTAGSSIPSVSMFNVLRTYPSTVMFSLFFNIVKSKPKSHCWLVSQVRSNDTGAPNVEYFAIELPSPNEYPAKLLTVTNRM